MITSTKHKDKKEKDYQEKKKDAVPTFAPIGRAAGLPIINIFDGAGVESGASTDDSPQPGREDSFLPSTEPDIKSRGDLVRGGTQSPAAPRPQFFEMEEIPDQYTEEEQKKLDKQKKIMRIFQGVNIFAQGLIGASGNPISGIDPTAGFWNDLAQNNEDYQDEIKGITDSNRKKEQYNLDLANKFNAANFEREYQETVRQLERAQEVDDRDAAAALQEKLLRMRLEAQRAESAADRDYKREYNYSVGNTNRLKAIDQFQEERANLQRELDALKDPYDPTKYTNPRRANSIMSELEEINANLDSMTRQQAERERFDLPEREPTQRNPRGRNFRGQPAGQQSEDEQRKIEAESVLNDYISMYEGGELPKDEAIRRMAPILMDLNPGRTRQEVEAYLAENL